MNKIVVVLVIALIALGGGTIHLWRHLDAGRQQIADLQARLDAMTAASQAAVPMFATQPGPAVSRDEPLPAAAPEASGAPAAVPAITAASTTDERVSALREMIASPEAQERTRNFTRAMLPSQYPDIGEELGLSPEEVNKLFDLLARQQADRTREVTAALGGDLAARQETITSEFQRRQQANQDELASMLGGKYSQWQAYNETLPSRRQVSELGTVLNTGGMPLSDTQRRPLIAALAAEQQRISQEASVAMQAGGSQRPWMMRSSPERNNRLVEAASPHLDTQQLESYRQMLERQGNMERMLQGALDDAQQRRAEAAPPR